MHAIAKIAENIRASIDREETGQTYSIDWSKAFDRIDLSVLIRELKLYDYRGKVCNLIESFLTNRLQHFDSPAETSKKGKVLCGVQQGSVLGLFLVGVFEENPHSYSG